MLKLYIKWELLGTLVDTIVKYKGNIEHQKRR